jgi:hypothetical protein
MPSPVLIMGHPDHNFWHLENLIGTLENET